MADKQSNIETIRTGILGRDVREALAETAEHVYTASEKTTEKVDELDKIISNAEAVAMQAAESAKSSAQGAAHSAVSAQGWAAGGTGTRADEETNNARYWAKIAMTDMAYIASGAKSLKEYFALLESQGGESYAALQQELIDFQTAAGDSFYNWLSGLQSTLTGNAEANLLHLINGLASRVETLENMVFTGFTSNPYLIRFDTLDGLTVDGTWNAALHCLEC